MEASHKRWVPGILQAMVLVLSGFAGAGEPAAAQDSYMCRLQADRVFQDCMSGRPDPGDCEYRTICDDTCSREGQKTCRVFDCRGVLFSFYEVRCTPPAPQYACVRCYLESEVWDSYYQTYKYRYCYKVYDTRDGRRDLVDFPCTGFEYDRSFAERRCNSDFTADLRCVNR